VFLSCFQGIPTTEQFVPSSQHACRAYNQPEGCPRFAQETPTCLPNKTGVTLQAAIFDCDGLLADTETPDYDAWRTLYAEHGLTLDVRDWAALIGVAKGHDLADWHQALAASVGPAYDRDAVTARRQAHYARAMQTLAPMPGVVALLDALALEGIPAAVASNSERGWVERVLGITGLAGRFAAIATADEVARPKPAPDVYLLAAQRLNIPPACCIAFEDSPRGLAAAHAAHMVTVAVPSALTRHLDWAQAHHLAETLETVNLELLRGAFST